MKSSLSGVQKFIKSLWRTQFTKWFNGNDLLIPAPSISYWLNRYAVLLSCKEMGHAGRWSPEEAALHSPHLCQSKPHCSCHISSSAGTCLMAELWVHPLLSGGLGAGGLGPWEQRRDVEISFRELCVGTPQGLSRAGGFCSPPYWAWFLVGRTTGKGSALFGSSWNLIRVFSIYKRRNAKPIPRKSSTCRSAGRHINLKSSCLRCKPSTVTASE